MPVRTPVNSHEPYAEDQYPLGTITATGAHALGSDEFAVAATLIVSLKSGTPTGVAPTLDGVIQDSLDGQDWNTLATLAQLTAASTRALVRVPASTPFAKRLRLLATVGGTSPSFPGVVVQVASERSG